MAKQGWIGVDLDGTLAHYDHVWRGADHIGAPIPAMVDRVRNWLAQGKTVKVFTARMSTRDDAELGLVAAAIAAWTEKHIGTRLEATCVKDYAMIELWDDRAIGVEPNTGRAMTEVATRDALARVLDAINGINHRVPTRGVLIGAADASPKQEQPARDQRPMSLYPDGRLVNADGVVVDPINRDPSVPAPKIILPSNPGRIAPSTEGCQ